MGFKMFENKITLQIFILFAITLFVTVEGVAESSESSSRSWYYMCPPDFIRLGNRCYYFSNKAETWQDAVFACKDRGSNLTAPERWEDRNLRTYLNRPEFEKSDRWIGGIYDWVAKAWKWGGEMKNMQYQSFKRMRHRSPESLMWHCVAMVPNLEYRWDAFTCMESKKYICQTKLDKVRRKERNELRNKWNPNGNGNKPNEIKAPRIPEIYNVDYDKHNNEISPNLHPRVNPARNRNRTYRPRLRPNGQQNPRKNSTDRSSNTTEVSNLRKKPFTNSKWNKIDPETAYLHNVKALTSGKTGLSKAQIEKHLRRLEKIRKKEEMNQKRKEREREMKYREAKAKNRNIDGNKRETKKGKKGKKTIENVTHMTYTMDTQISELHPKQIVEVHDFSVE